MILTIGILFGYLLLPVLLVSHLGFEDTPMPKPRTGKLESRPRYSYTTPNRVRGQGKPEAIAIPKIAPDTRSLTPNVDMTSAEERLVEDHNILAKQSLPTGNTPHIMKTITLPDHQRRKILVTGGAGFVGSHLVDKLMMEGHEVTVVDNFFTGQKKNIAHWLHHPNFRYVWESSRGATTP
jgi:UDP-glucuronate decarboxylase